MNYFILRGDQKFGPYTLAQVHEHMQTGHIIPSDLAQSEGMTDWVPVSQVLGNIPLQTVTTYGGAAAAPAPIEVPVVPLPVNFHWGWLLLIEVLTRNYFNFIWALYLANWARKLDGQNKHLVLVAMYPAGMIAGIIAMSNQNEVVGSILIIGGLITYLVGIFSIRGAMEDYYNSRENVGLTLSGGMTFFFSTVYLQYHINKLHKWKKTGVYGA
jgi:hypothetical protein